MALFRICFGFILVWQVLRYFENGWIESYYVEPTFHFKYYGFGWVQPWPQPWLNVHFVALGVLALGIAVGWFYRFCAVGFFFGFTYIYLLDQARYLNHFYLVCLLSLLLIFLPAQRCWSVDAWRRPGVRWLPVGGLWILRIQIAVVYVFAAVAKMNGDWLRAQPLKIWLARRESHPYLGPFFDHPAAPWLFAYGGLLLDLLVVPLLLWRRTRTYALLCMLLFHLLNANTFGIGIFPWTMIPASLLLLEPDWPLRVKAWLVGRVRRLRSAEGEAQRPYSAPRPTPDERQELLPSRTRQRWVAAAFLAFVTVQVLVPLRHFLYPGPVSWTEEGHRFSWHMMLRSKRARASFRITDPVRDEHWLVDPAADLAEWQVSGMSGRPDMILQYAQFLAERFRARGHERVEVRATVQCSLNGRQGQLLIDPDVDLARVRRDLRPASWILPLTEPLGSEP